jgi:hypothetical protein
MPLTKIQSLGITDGTIVNADINASAAIAGTKLSGAGKILQVSSIASTASSQAIATQTYTDLTSLSLSITPSSASNKILLMANIQGSCEHDEGFGVRLLRDATNIFTTSNVYGVYNYGVGDLAYLALPVVYIDSPSTTSSITYKVQSATWQGNSITFNNGIQSIFYAMEIAS